VPTTPYFFNPNLRSRRLQKAPRRLPAGDTARLQWLPSPHRDTGSGSAASEETVTLDTDLYHIVFQSRRWAEAD
jgi:hypothetical protein